MHNILLIGANGFLGRELIKAFEEHSQDFKLYKASRSNEDHDYKLDISLRSAFDVIPDGLIHTVINCASKLPGSDYQENEFLNELFQANVLGAQNICNWVSKQEQIEAVINCSTLSVIEKPWPINLNEKSATYPTGRNVHYGGSKLWQELIFNTLGSLHNKKVANLRFSALYGKDMNWGGVLCSFIARAFKSKAIEMTNGNKVFADFLHVKDAAAIILAVLKNKYEGLLNSASCHEISLLELANCINKHFNNTINISNEDKIDFYSRAKISSVKLDELIDRNQFVRIEDGVLELIETYKLKYA